MKKFILDEKRKVALILLIATLVHSGLRFYIDMKNLYFYVLFAISNILVYKTCKLLFKDSLVSLLACFFNAFSLIAIQSGSYSIIYDLCNFFILAIAYFHAKIWRKNLLKWYNLLPIVLTVILGSLTHYLFLVFFAIVYLLYSLKTFKTKKYASFLKYQISIIVSVLLYIIAIFGFKLPISNYAIGNFNVLFNAFKCILLINQEFFNNLFLLFVIILAFVCYRKKCKKLKFNSQIYLFVLPIIVYLLVTSIFASCIEITSIIPIYSVFFISMFYLAKKYMFEHLENRECIFLLILFVTIFAYSSITALIF